MAEPVLAVAIKRLERAAAELRAGEIAPERAAALVEDCARLAAEAANELDREIRAAEVHVTSDDQLRLGGG